MTFLLLTKVTKRIIAEKYVTRRLDRTFRRIRRARLAAWLRKRSCQYTNIPESGHRLSAVAKGRQTRRVSNPGEPGGAFVSSFLRFFARDGRASQAKRVTQELLVETARKKPGKEGFDNWARAVPPQA